MTRRGRAIHRQDSTAAALIAEAKAYGAQYLPLDGVIDGVLFYQDRVLLVDFKGPTTRLTANQLKLVQSGWPIWFLRDSEQLRKLLDFA